jgi:hypothetical protein
MRCLLLGTEGGGKSKGILAYDILVQLRLQTVGAVSTRETKWNFEVSVSDALKFLSEFPSAVLGVRMGWWM